MHLTFDHKFTTAQNTTALNNFHTPVGIIGAGSFGTAIAQLLAINTEVLLYTRREALANAINETHQHLGYPLSPRIRATSDPQYFTHQCTLIFPIVPSLHFRSMMREFSPYLRPYHLLIHGTKGLDANDELTNPKIGTAGIYTMSDVIRQESSVVRIGCLSGPNLSEEILQGQPAATVIASRFKEVVSAGRAVLRSHNFHVFSNYDLYGAELAGALKNTIAIGSGILGGKALGYNIWALLITRGLMEMIHFGKALGANIEPFLGIAGIGDLVATASTTKSRNYTVGFRLAKGESLQNILQSMQEPAEGVRTIKLVKQLADMYKISAPITRTIYKTLYENLEIERAIAYLMSYPYSIDVDYL